MLDPILVDKGSLLALASVYIDESGTHAGSSIMTIGGVVFKRRKARDFSREWSAYLRAKGVPYFHMTDVTHPQGTIYNGWTADKLVKFEKKLIALVGKNADYGFAVSISESEFNAEYGDVLGGWSREDIMGSAYTYLLRHALSKGAAWAEESGFSGDISYFFEAGHLNQHKASEIISTSMRQQRSGLREKLPSVEANRIRHK